MELNELEQLIKQLKSVLSQAETVLGTPTSETTSIPQNNIESTLGYGI